jgi:predicted amidohydrolase YtcJ
MPEPEPSFWLLDVRRPGSERRLDLQVDAGAVTAVVDHGAGSPSPDRPVIDADGRWVIPGLWDGHVHTNQYAIQQSRIDLSAATSAAHAVQLVADALAGSYGRQRPADEPVVGARFQDGLWPDRPHKRLLDERFGELPVILVAHDLHCGWVSSAALALMGHAEHPTGVLTETVWMDAMSRIRQPSPERADALVKETMAGAVARGLTGIRELEFSDNLTDWQRRFDTGGPRLRVVCGIRDRQLTREITRGLRDGEALPGTDGLITMGPVKVFVDGSLNTRTALCHHSYPGGDDHGEMVLDHDGLVAIMNDAARHGLTMAVHAIGDAANSIALDCFEQTGISGRIEHAQLLTEADLPRFAELGVIASVQPWHAIDDWQVADHYWADQTDRAFPLSSLVAAGATIEFGSDAPVAPLDPWRTIAAAVDRASLIGREWHPESQISIADALRFSTRGREVVRAGDLADLVLLDCDPYTLSGPELITIGVHATAVAGRWLHGPAEFQSWQATNS